MLGGHLYELIIVLVIALVVFGPKRLPELGSSLGQSIREFRKASTELHNSVTTDSMQPLPSEHQQDAASSDASPRHAEAAYVVMPSQQTTAPSRAVAEHDRATA